MQLDLFDDSRDTAMRNDVIAALRHLDRAPAKKALARLAAEYPQDILLPALALLQEALSWKVPCFEDVEKARAAVCRIGEEFAPAARKAFGARDAELWLAPLRQSLARAAEGRPYDPETPDIHAAPLLLALGDWPAAIEAIEAIPSWRRIPFPLGWAITARFHHEGLDEIWPLLFELAWMAPDHFATLAPALDAPPLARLLQGFEREFEDGVEEAGGYAWFPAWALVEQPALAPLVRGVRGSHSSQAERSAELLRHLLTLEKQGRHDEIVILRKRLKDLHEGLFSRYMASR